MDIEIITPDKKLFKGEIQSVKVPGSKGPFMILNNHAPIISVLRTGKVKIVDKEKKVQFFEIRGGVIEVLHNKILILSE